MTVPGGGSRAAARHGSKKGIVMLTLVEAKALTARIQVDQDAVDDLIVAAFKGSAHVVLGFKNWGEYAQKSFPKFKQTPSARLASVLKMKEAEMSTHSIGAALGVGQRTVVKDLTDNSHKSESNDSVAGEITEETPKARKPPASVKPKSDKQSRKYIEAYAKIVAEHPTWSVKQITQYLVKTYPALTEGGQKFAHQDVGRLRMWNDAPQEFRTAWYDGVISAAVGETILSNKSLDEADQLNLLDKVLVGLIPAGAPGLRKVMDELPSTFGRVKDKWMDRELAMTYDDLLVAKADQQAASNQSFKKSTEQINGFKAGIKIDYGIKTEKWINGLDAELDLVEDELPTIMALTFKAKEMAQKLRDISTRMWNLAEMIDNGGVKPEAKTGMTSYTTVDADEDWDNHDPANHSSNGWAGTVIDG